jgi:cell division protein FtsA
MGFRLDGVSGTSDPRGMAARKITADLHAVTADDSPLRNLLMTVERCYLNAAGLVPSGLAASIATTTAEERHLGITCIDIGGGSTTLAVFAEGRFLFTENLSVGGSHITFDIARSLQTPLAEAERIKALYGTLAGAPSDEHEIISYPIAGADEGAQAQTTKASLSAVIRPRFESLVASVRERMEAAGVAGYAGEHMVLTGGSCQLSGATELVSRMFRRPVRVGRPESLSGLPPAMSGPAFATVVGLLGASVMAGNEAAQYRERQHLVQGYLGRVGEWLKHGF